MVEPIGVGIMIRARISKTDSLEIIQVKNIVHRDALERKRCTSEVMRMNVGIAVTHLMLSLFKNEDSSV